MVKLIYDKQMLALWLEIMSFKTKQDGFSYKQKLISVLYLLAIHSFSIANKLEPIPAEFTTNVLSNVTFLSRYFFEHWWQACGSKTVCGSCERQTVQFWFMVQRFSHNQRYVQVGVIFGDVLYKLAYYSRGRYGNNFTTIWAWFCPKGKHKDCAFLWYRQQLSVQFGKKMRQHTGKHAQERESDNAPSGKCGAARCGWHLANKYYNCNHPVACFFGGCKNTSLVMSSNKQNQLQT